MATMERKLLERVSEKELRLRDLKRRGTTQNIVLERLKSKPSLRYIIRDGWVQAFESSLPTMHNDDVEDDDLGVCPWVSSFQVSGRRDSVSQVQGSFGVFECGKIKVADSSTKFINISSKVRLAKWLRKIDSPKFAICPPSGWIRWDFEIDDVAMFEKMIHKNPNSLEVGSEFLRCISVENPWVMKKDGASGGTGIVFVSNLAEVKKALDEGRDMEEALPFLDDRRESIPNWAIQQHINNPLLLDGHKFHLRAFVISVGSRLFVYETYEVRVAPVKWNRDFTVQGCHITNGGGAEAHHERRYLSNHFPELSDVTPKVLPFLEYILKRCQEPEAAEVPDSSWIPAAVMGLDIMVDEQKNLFLLEANHSPAAPPYDETHQFGCHVRRFCQRLVRLLISSPQGGVIPGFFEIT